MRRPDPKKAAASEFARFTTTKWQGMDGFYRFWGHRWVRVVDFLRAVHWKLSYEIAPKKIPAWKEFTVINTTLGFYNDYLTQWLQSRVRFFAMPDSPDPADVAGAELADHILAYLWDLLEVDSKKIDIGAWLAATGNADL